MSKRISANMFVKNPDGSFASIPNVDVTRKELLDMLNDKDAVPSHLADGAGDFELVNFWFNKADKSLKSVLLRSSVAITDAQKSLVEAVFSANPAKEVLTFRTFRPYRSLNDYQVQVQKFLEDLIITEDIASRAEMVDTVRGLLVELGLDSVNEFESAEIYATDSPEEVESVDISGSISVDADAETAALADIDESKSEEDSDEEFDSEAYAEAKSRSF